MSNYEHPNRMRAQISQPSSGPSLVRSSICERSVDSIFYAWQTVASGLGEKASGASQRPWLISIGRKAKASSMSGEHVLWIATWKSNESTEYLFQIPFVARCLVPVPIICWHIRFFNDFRRTKLTTRGRNQRGLWRSAAVLPLATCKQHLPAFNSPLSKDWLMH